jgi:hypothetical protein
MTANAVYCDALGRFESIDNLADFLRLFDSPDHDIWIGETGEMGIWRDDGGNAEQSLILAYVPNVGFTFHNTDADGRTRVACEGNDVESISYDAGGRSVKRPKRAFFNRTRSKALVTYFIVNGGLDDSVFWLSLTDLWAVA